MPIAIEMADVSKAYGKEPYLVKALKNVTFSVQEGEFVAILGPSGSGKTTLMNIIGLIDTLDMGIYKLDGVDIRKHTEDQFSEIRNKKIGFVFQKFNLIGKFTALHNVALPLLFRGESIHDARKKATEILEKLGLGDRINHRPNELSGGQQQRVAIARALVGDASIILADEPTGNLDSNTGSEIIDLLVDLNKQGKTIVLITHDQYVAEKANRIISVKDGEINITE